MFMLTTQLLQSKLFCLDCVEYFTCNQITNLLELESTTHLANQGSLQLFRWYQWNCFIRLQLRQRSFPPVGTIRPLSFPSTWGGKSQSRHDLWPLGCPWDLHRITHDSTSLSYQEIMLRVFLPSCRVFFSPGFAAWHFQGFVNLQCPRLSQAFCHNSWAHGRTQGHYTTAHQSLLQWPTHLVLNNMNQHLQVIENCQPFKSHPRQFYDRVKILLKLLLHCFAIYDLSEINKFHRNSPKLKRNIEALRTNAKTRPLLDLKIFQHLP